MVFRQTTENNSESRAPSSSRVTFMEEFRKGQILTNKWLVCFVISIVASAGRQVWSCPHSAGLVTKDSGWACNIAKAAWGEGMVAKEGGVVRRAVGGMEVNGRGLERSADWLVKLEEEATLLDRKEAEWRDSWALASGLVVRERGWACSEWVAAGAAGDAKAVEGVAGESNILPCEEAGLSQDFSTGRYCTHGFLLFEATESDRKRKKWFTRWFLSNLTHRFRTAQGIQCFSVPRKGLLV